MKFLKTFSGIMLIFISISCSKDEPTSPVLPPNKLIAYYPFNGNANDESGNGNHGIVYGAALTIDRFGNQNSAFSFDGVNDYIYRNYDPTSGLHPTNGPFTISAWFKTNTSLPIEQVIVSTHYAGVGDGYHCAIDTDSSFLTNNEFRIRCFFDGHDWVLYSNSVSDGEWHQLIFIWKDDVDYLYLDAEFQDSTLAVGAVAYNNQARFKIGHSDNAPWEPDSIYYFKGSIDDIRIYNSALSESEIQELYRDGGWGN